MGKGVAQSVRGAGEMARGLGDAMIQSPVKNRARILNEFSRMGCRESQLFRIFLSVAARGG